MYINKAPLIDRLLQFKEDGSAVEVDLFLRDCLRCYPNTQSALLKQLVATLAKVSPVRIENDFAPL